MADGWTRAAVVLIAAVAIAAALRAASLVFAPLAFALFIVALVWPLQRALQSRLPVLVAWAVALIATVLVFASFASVIAWGFTRVGQWLIANAAQYQALYDKASTWLEGHGIGIAALWTEHFNVSWLIRFIQQIAGSANSIVTFWLIVLAYVMLGLLEIDKITRRVAAMKNSEAARILSNGTAETAVKWRRYMVVRTLMSVTTGVLVWAFAALFGLPLAVEWGIISFLLNYIPFIGPLIATVLPAVFALLQFASWQAALAVFICLLVLQNLVGTYVEPRLSGTMLAISPVVILFSVFFWSFLWGIGGAFIGVPIAIAVLSFCAQHPSTRWLVELFGTSRGKPAVDIPRG